jgi:hypothetical protein
MNMHWVTAKVNLSGQNYHIYEYREHEPLSWPQVQVLMALHGEENVFDIKPVFVSNISPSQEKQRLLQYYNEKIVEQVFPGRSPRMEMCLPDTPENQPRCDNDGQPIIDAASTPIGGDDDDEPIAAAGREPPIAPAVFVPGRHPRPPAGG